MDILREEQDKLDDLTKQNMIMRKSNYDVHFL